MAPTCASNSNSSSSNEEEAAAPAPPSTKGAAEASVSSITSQVACLTAEDLLDSGPFYGMFNRDSDDDDAAGSSWTQLRPPALSPRAASIPEASETFQKVMRQLDGISEDCGLAAAAAGCGGGVKKDKAAAAADKPEQRKSCIAVKKAASFSVSDRATASSSSSSRDSAARAEEAKRRRSVPCMAGPKHVQWADQAGVAKLVSVRLIRPRLQAKAEKDESQLSIPRSILKRLTGIH